MSKENRIESARKWIQSLSPEELKEQLRRAKTTCSLPESVMSALKSKGQQGERQIAMLLLIEIWLEDHKETK